MNILDRIAKRLGYVKPGKPLGPGRNYDAGIWNRLNSDMPTCAQTIDSILRVQLTMLRARSRYLGQSNEYGKKFKQMVRTNILGAAGILLKSKAMDPAPFPGGEESLDKRANKIIQDAWWEWGRYANCTTSGRMCWNQVQNLVVGTLPDDGEALVRIVTPFANQFNFALELLHADQLDHHKNEIMKDGRKVRLGVEVDKWDRPVAYWIHKQSPNDNGFYYGDQSHLRVPASEIIHIYLPEYIGQHRGVPWMGVTAQSLNMLGRYEEAELVAARVAAAKCGFFRNPDGTPFTGETDNAGNPIMETEPGGFQDIGNKELVEWNPQHPNQQFPSFVKQSLRRVAAGLGVCYNTLANDLEGVNFSSGRLGLNEERDFWKLLQEWLSEELHNRVFSAWLQPAMDMGQLAPLRPSLLDKYNAATWVSRRWTWVDPLKDATAAVTELKNGLTSHTRILAERGLDEDEILAEIAAFKAKAEGLGLNFSDVFVPEEMPEEPLIVPG